MCFLIATRAFGAAAATQESTPDVTRPDLTTPDALILSLAADDSTIRAAAAEKLVNLGRIGRGAVLAASHGDDPEIRQQARQVLLKLPWSDPNDPPAVRAILDVYPAFEDEAHGEQPPATPVAPGTENRKAAATALANLPGFQGCDALIRLVYEDPDNSVRWAIVRLLRTNVDAAHLARLRRTDAPADDPPLAALYGLGWLTADPQKALPLLQQAAGEEFDQPSEDGGELDFAVQCLVNLDEGFGHYADAAAVLRSQMAHSPPKDQHNTPLPLLRLMALQADYGPLAGFDTDQTLAGDYPDDPALLYATARIDLRLHKDDDAAAARKAAFDAGRDWRMARFDVGKFLAERGWNDEAATEFKAFLAAPAGNDEADPNEDNANAHFQLATLAARNGDDTEAAEQKKTAMSILGGGADGLVQTDALQRESDVSENQIWAEIHWHYLRAALARHDPAEVDRQVVEVLRLNPTDEDIAIDLVPLLKSRGKQDEAVKLFGSAHQAAASALSADPTNAGLMNGLAWLDAKCDESLSEAEKLATASVTALPRDPAVIDTLAEVNFHLRRYERAVQLEQKALSLDPGDPFMTGQLARFKAAQSH